MNVAATKNLDREPCEPVRGEFSTKASPKRPRRRSRRDTQFQGAETSCFPQNTNQRPLTDNQRALADRHLALARSIAGRYLGKGPIEREEIESAAYLGLVEAARAYKPGGEATFATYARFHITGAVRELFSNRYASRDSRSFSSINKRAREEVDTYGKPVGISPTPPIGSELDSADEVESHLKPMLPVQAWICRKIYLEDKTPDEVAQMMDCTRSYVSRIHREAIEFLGERLLNRSQISASDDTQPAKAFLPARKSWRDAQRSLSRQRMPRSCRMAVAS